VSSGWCTGGCWFTVAIDIDIEAHNYPGFLSGVRPVLKCGPPQMSIQNSVQIEEHYVLCIYKSTLGFTLFHIRGGLESKRQNIFISTLSPRYQNLEHHGMLHDPLEMKQS